MTWLFNENIRIEQFESGVNSKSNSNVCLDKNIQTSNMDNLLFELGEVVFGRSFESYDFIASIFWKSNWENVIEIC